MNHHTKVDEKPVKKKKTAKKASRKIVSPVSKTTQDTGEEWIGVLEWARRRGTKPAYYYRFVKEGKLGAAAKKDRRDCWKVLFPKCDQIMNALQSDKHKKTAATKKRLEGKNIVDTPGESVTIDPNAGDFLNETTQQSIVAKSQKEYYAAKNEKLKFDKSAGLLIEKDFVEKGLYDIAKMIRDKLLTLPSRVSSELAALESASDVQIYLQTELNVLLEELHDTLGKWTNDLDK